jgi:hypothetical protein
VLDDCVFVLAPVPKFGLHLMHAATTCGSIWVKALVACLLDCADASNGGVGTSNEQSWAIWRSTPLLQP